MAPYGTAVVIQLGGSFFLDPFFHPGYTLEIDIFNQTVSDLNLSKIKKHISAKYGITFV